MVSNTIAMIRVISLAKNFTLHLQGGVRLPVLDNAELTVHAGECVVLTGPSGLGKSTLLKMVYGNYRTDSGQVWVRDGEDEVDVAKASPQRLIQLRRHRIGYVSQFLRCLPRVPAVEIVAEPLIEAGAERLEALKRAKHLLARLNIPERLFGLPPATFSGGEQQRVNIARGFVYARPVLLLDEPTASLDPVNRAVVVDLITEAKKAGAAMLGIFHDLDVRAAVADRTLDLTAFRAAA
ncbi:MAG: phosphonate C-P lyase system protein PhnL [Geminicoccaceae bacterium]